MHLRNLLRAVSASAFLLVSGLASAACGTCASPINDSQPANNQGLQNGFILGPAASNLNALSTAISGFAGDTGGTGSAGLNFNRYALGAGTGAAAAPGRQQWNVWGAYSHSNVGYDYAPLSSAGTVKVYLAGVDYTFNNNIVFGVAAAFDHTDTDLNFSGGKLDGSGYTISPYVGMLINKNWALDGTIGFGRTDIDTSVSGVTGSTHSDRTLGALGLTYRQAFGAWTLTGRGAILGVHNKLGSYSLSNTAFIPDASANLAQVRLTGQAAYTFRAVTPYVSLSYINDVTRPDQAPISGIPASNDRDGWLPAVGIRFKAENMIYGSAQYSSERGRSQITNNQFLLSIGIRF